MAVIEEAGLVDATLPAAVNVQAVADGQYHLRRAAQLAAELAHLLRQSPGSREALKIHAAEAAVKGQAIGRLPEGELAADVDGAAGRPPVHAAEGDGQALDDDVASRPFRLQAGGADADRRR